jgi:hypothetical protein
MNSAPASVALATVSAMEVTAVSYTRSRGRVAAGS